MFLKTVNANGSWDFYETHINCVKHVKNMGMGINRAIYFLQLDLYTENKNIFHFEYDPKIGTGTDVG
jgi:hypothetical protein